MPEWTPVVEALPTLMAGRRLIVDVIRQIDADHDALSPIDCLGSLWMEREIKSVEVIPLEKANDALAMLRAGAGRRGATVLRPHCFAAHHRGRLTGFRRQKIREQMIGPALRPEHLRLQSR